jgi:TetR/AcrR family transcriptional regulator
MSQAIKKRSIPLKGTSEAPTTAQKILFAARLEFSERGFDGARMQAIADKAGTNKALLHYYFRSKEGLFKVTLKDILSNLWADVHRQMDAHQDEKNLRALINAIVSAYITTFAAQPDLPRMVVREITVRSPIFCNVIDDVFSSLEIVPKTIFSIYNKELAKGAIKHIDVIHFMMNLMSMCAITFVVKPIAEYMSKKMGAPINFNRKFYAKRIEAITEMACDGIFIDKTNPAKRRMCCRQKLSTYPA